MMSQHEVLVSVLVKTECTFFLLLAPGSTRWRFVGHHFLIYTPLLLNQFVDLSQSETLAHRIIMLIRKVRICRREPSRYLLLSSEDCGDTGLFDLVVCVAV